MSTTELFVERAVTPETLVVSARISVHAGVITAAAQSAAQGEPMAGTLLPGLIDLQVNGAGGRSVDEATPEALDTVAQAVWQGGAVAFLPTLITAPWEQLLQQVAAVAGWIEGWSGSGAEPLGLHLEGPFLDAPGVHDAACFLDPTPERIATLREAARGRLRLLTMANTRKGAAAAVGLLRQHDIAVALGHTPSTEGFADCVAAGAGLVTHLFNAMGGLHHRQPGVAGLALDTRDLQCTLIVDGAHVHPAMLRNACRILGTDRTILVTDAVAAAGMPDGPYRLAGIEVHQKDGIVRDKQGRLAGSALTMGRAVRNFLDCVPWAGPWTAARVASTNPARAIGAKGYGSILPGSKAAFTLLDDDGSVRAIRL